MIRSVVGRLEALVRPYGTASRRRASLPGGLLLLAGVNYLDLTGHLALSLSPSGINWLAVGWVLIHGLAMDYDHLVQKLSARLGDLLLLVGVGFALLGGAYLDHPEASIRYVTYATPYGQLGTALGQVVLPAFLVAVGAQFIVGQLEWWDEYLYLRRTSAEERVLEDDYRP